jgi:hypothetical protein
MKNPSISITCELFRADYIRIALDLSPRLETAPEITWGEYLAGWNVVSLEERAFHCRESCYCKRLPKCRKDKCIPLLFRDSPRELELITDFHLAHAKSVKLGKETHKVL